MKFRWFALIVLVLAAPNAFSQALVDRVPADAWIYVGWAGADTLGPAYDKSKFKKFIDASNIPELLNKSLPQAFEKISDEPDPKKDAAETVQVLKILAAHPTGYYTGAADFKADPENGVVHIGVLCKAGNDKDALIAAFEKIAEHHRHSGTNKDLAKVLSDGDLVALFFGYGDKENPLAAGAESLGKSSGFMSVHKQLASQPAIVIYLDGGAIVSILDTIVKNGNDEESIARWTRGLEASGLSGLKRYVYSAGFSGEDWVSQSFIDAPAPRKGLLKLLETSTIDPALLAKIPADATSASVVQFDFAALISTARDITMAVDPQAGDMFQKGMGFISLSLGRRLDTELLEPLGSQWAVYSAPSLGVSGPANMVLVNKVDDPKLAKAAWSDLSFALSNTLPSLLKRQGITLVPTTDEKSVPGSTIFTMKINGGELSPGWVFAGDYMYLGADPAVLAKAATAAAPAKIDTNAKFKDIMSTFAASSYSSFSYNDLSVTAAEGDKAFGNIWNLAKTKADEQGIDLPEKLLPPMEKIQQLFGPAGSIGWEDEKVFYTSARSPFPGSTIVYGSSQGESMQLGTIGGAALGVSILLPSLNRSRVIANRVKSASNLKQISNALILYANENKGIASPDLGTLLLKEDVTLSVFICPSGNTKIPSEFNLRPTDTKMADWVTEHSDYVYIKPNGLLSQVGADAPLAYEKIGLNGPDGINILYGDGHMDFISNQAAINLIKKSTGSDPVQYGPNLKPSPQSK